MRTPDVVKLRIKLRLLSGKPAVATVASRPAMPAPSGYSAMYRYASRQFLADFTPQVMSVCREKS